VLEPNTIWLCNYLTACNWHKDRTNGFFGRALCSGAGMSELDQRPDIGAHLYAMVERLHNGRVTSFCGGGHHFGRFDQIRQPNGATIGTR
jgi:hypothetical protein